MSVYARIAGTGSYLPAKILSNDDLAKIVDTSDEWITKRVGIKERRVANEQETCSFMAAEAAKQALEMAQLPVDQIDMIIVATVTPDRSFPSTAIYVQELLGLENVPAYDLNAACSGFIYALSTAEVYIRSGDYKNILVIGADALTRMVDWEDRSTCVLFGDGAGAAVVSASDAPGIMTTVMHSHVSNTLTAENNLWAGKDDQTIKMDGASVFRFAVQKLGEVVDEILTKGNMQPEKLDWLIPHQANYRIIAATAKKLDMSLERVILTVQDHGNTSAASIPLALDRGVRDNKIKRGDNLLLEAFGAGYTWGAALVKF